MNRAPRIKLLATTEVGQNQTVASLFSLIYNGRFVSIRVNEYVEAVAEKIHLEYRLFGGHWLKFKGFNSYLKLRLLGVLVVIVLGNDEGALFDGFFKGMELF